MLGVALQESGGGRAPVVVGVGGLQGVLDGAVKAERLGSRSLDHHVRAAHRLGPAHPALLRGARHVKLDPRRRILQVALRATAPTPIS